MTTDDLVTSMKQGMRLLASGVCVVSSIGEDGTPLAMTATSVTSVSDSPPSLLVCINKQARLHDVLCKPDSRFVVNILAGDHEHISNNCANPDQLADRFTQGSWDFAGGIPVLGDALAIFKCRVDQMVPYGTHGVFIGAIETVDTPDANGNGALIYLDAGYHRLI